MTDAEYKKQACASFRNKGIFILMMLGVILCIGLSACGKKPGSVDAPPDVTEDKFPLVYPDPATDPKP